MRRLAFTLIELLVVIAIIAILAAILFPVFAQAKEAAKKTAEISNFKQFGTSTHIYLSDTDDRFMPSGGSGNCWGCSPPEAIPGTVMMPYMKNTTIMVGLKDTFSELDRIKDHCAQMGWNINNLTTDQRLFALSVRSNMGYNYQSFAPWRYGAATNYRATSGTTPGSEVSNPSGTLLFADAIWDRKLGGGAPTGGGNWVVETPCWTDANGAWLRPMNQYANAPGGDGTLFKYTNGWRPPTAQVDQYSWLVYGGTWPFWNQKSLNNIQPGLVDGREVVEMADTSTRTLPLGRIADGCNPWVSGSFKGVRTDADKFLWDLD